MGTFAALRLTFPVLIECIVLSCGFTIPPNPLRPATTVDQSLCISNHFDWFPYEIVPQNVYASPGITSLLSPTNQLIESEDGIVDSSHTQTTWEGYINLLPNLLATQFYKLAAFERVLVLTGEFLTWCENTIRQIDSSNPAWASLSFTESYLVDQLYEYGVPGIIVYPSHRGGDFTMSEIYLHYSGVASIDLSQYHATAGTHYKFDEFLFNLSRQIICEQLNPATQGGSTISSCLNQSLLTYISDKFNQSFLNLQSENYVSIPASTTEEFFERFPMSDPQTTLESIAYEVALFEEINAPSDTGLTATCDDHLFFTYSDCATCQTIIGTMQPPLNIEDLVTTLDQEVYHYFEILQNTTSFLVESLKMVNNSINNVTVSTHEMDTTVQSTTTPQSSTVKTSTQVPPSSSMEMTSDALIDETTTNVNFMSSSPDSLLSSTEITTVWSSSTIHVTSEEATTMPDTTIAEITTGKMTTNAETTEVETTTWTSTSGLLTSTTDESHTSSNGGGSTSKVGTTTTSQNANGRTEPVTEPSTKQKSTESSTEPSTKKKTTELSTEPTNGTKASTTTDDGPEDPGNPNNGDPSGTGTFMVESISDEVTFMLSPGDTVHEFEVDIFGNFDGLSTSDVVLEMIRGVTSFQGSAQTDMTVKKLNDHKLTILVTSDISASWTFKIKINGKDVVVGDETEPKEIDVNIEHPPPMIESIEFTNTGNAIDVVFNCPVTVNKTKEGCRKFFTDVTKFGEGASCSFTSPTTLQIVIGRGDNLITTGDELMFRENSIKPARQLRFSYLDANQPQEVGAPSVTPEVKFTLSGPATINNCGSYQISAEQIRGHGGRRLTYEWRLTSPDTAQPRESSLSTENLQQATKSLPINASTLVAGTTYTLELTATNFLDATTTLAHTFTVENAVKPVLQIIPANVVPTRVKTSTRVRLEADVRFSFGESCSLKATDISYQWTPPQNLPLEATDMRVLVIPSNTLPVGTDNEFTVTVTSTIGGKQITVIESITLTTVETPLEAIILGASLVMLGPSDAIILDGSTSFDPDQPDAELTFGWECLTKPNDDSCDTMLGESVNSKMLTVSASNFSPGSFEITLTVSKNSTSTSASVHILVKSHEIPVVTLKTRSGKRKFRENEDIYLQANIKSGSPITDVSWQELNERLDSSTWSTGTIKSDGREGKYKTHAVIPTDQTEPGMQYSIEVRALAENGKLSTATIELSTYQTISQCVITSTSYIEMESITITATDCVTDPDSEPLTYQPFLGLASSEEKYITIVLDGSRRDSEQTVIATPIDYHENKVLVGFKVCDLSMTCIDVVTDADYNPRNASLSDQEREMFIAEKITSQLSKGNVANAFSNSINMANLEKKFLVEQRRRRKRDAFSDFSVYIEGDIDSVLLVLDDDFFSEALQPEVQTRIDEVSNFQTDVLSQIVDYGITDSSEGDMILDLSSQMVQQSFDAEDISTTLDAFERIIMEGNKEGHQQNIGTVERTMTTLSTSEKRLNTLSDLDKVNELRQKISELRRSELIQAAKDLTIGSHVILDVSGERAAVFCFLPEGSTNAWEAQDDFPVNLRPGESLVDRFDYDWCTDSENIACAGLKAIMIQVEALNEDINQCSDLTDVTLINPVTDEYQHIVDLSVPLEVEMGVTEMENGLTCKCKFWNETTSRLETTGVTSEVSGGKLVCKSTHLTSFVGVVQPASEDLTTDEPDNEGAPTGKAGGLGMGALIGIIVGILVLIAIVIVIVVVFYKVNQNKKVRPDDD